MIRILKLYGALWITSTTYMGLINKIIVFFELNLVHILDFQKRRPTKILNEFKKINLKFLIDCSWYERLLIRLSEEMPTTKLRNAFDKISTFVKDNQIVLSIITLSISRGYHSIQNQYWTFFYKYIFYYIHTFIYLPHPIQLTKKIME